MRIQRRIHDVSEGGELNGVSVVVDRGCWLRMVVEVDFWVVDGGSLIKWGVVEVVSEIVDDWKRFLDFARNDMLVSSLG
jgi:hypothetical protein